MTTPYDPYPGGITGTVNDLPPSTPVFSAAGPSRLLISGKGILVGWSVRNTDAAAGHVCYLANGSDDTATPMGYSKPASSGGTDTQSPSPPGVIYKDGLWFHDGSGFVDCVAWVVPL